MASSGEYQGSFGPNVWLIDEMYRQFRNDPSSVSESWREFLADYIPVTLPSGGGPAETQAVLHEDEQPGAAVAAIVVPAGAKPIRGGAARIVENMERSLRIPTATSVRTIPVKLLEENRRIMNQHLADLLGGNPLGGNPLGGNPLGGNPLGGKLSFTHLIAWSILKALRAMSAMTSYFAEVDGIAYKATPEHVNFGLAVDLEKPDGTRALLVPNIKSADELDFGGFFTAYNELLLRVHANQIGPADLAGTTVTLTNPGMIGTMQSVPRLMQGQGLIVATGAIDYPPEYHSSDPQTIAHLGIGKVMTVTATYDHRIIQGAESGMFLRRIHALLTGEEGFYEEVFASLKIPEHPIRLTRDLNPAIGAGESGATAAVEKQASVLQLINIYRVRGHLQANLNPLVTEAPTHSELDPGRYGLSLWDLDRSFITGGLAGRAHATLREILDILRDAYCRTIGVEYMHIQEPEQKGWIQRRVEGGRRRDWVDLAAKRRILKKLNAAEAFEKFLHRKYVGHKRFSLEGAESLIPMLDFLLNLASTMGIEEAVIGMAHRGRLNVLANILGKSYSKIFLEFEDVDPATQQGSGDVKYHLGATGSHQSPDGRTIDLTLASNPSHLEAVDPVVEGMARAKQDLRRDTERSRVLPILIHGDAAFAGQGVVAETLNLSALNGYRTGGSVHIVVNNGIGFTTAAVDARSSVYATDVAKMVQAPIIHVNGDDPEACVRVIELALAFRQEFKKDVVVDMICYRRHGHNEGDEPSYTQPLMYASIDQRRSVRKLYTEALVNRGDITVAEAEEALDDFRNRLEAAFAETHDSAPASPDSPRHAPPETADPSVPTGVPRETLDQILTALTTVGGEFELHPKLARQIEARGQMLVRDAVDWATAEALAIGSLLIEGTPIRLSGQDSRRGTFSQRHSVLVDHRNGAEFVPINHIREGQARLMPYDSLLSEYAVLGFEYGYSVAWKEAMVLWEAQFGDFANGAQIIIDQFLAAAEDKWGQTSRLVMLLPHGHEGQGPEHSSGRIERFLTLCAGANMRVAVPTTAAQYFHLLRGQVHQPRAAPLIIMTPKSLLRAESAKSGAAELTSGSFRQLLHDPAPPHTAAAAKLVLCTGKVAHDLIEYRRRTGITDTAIVRVEQLYPFPAEELEHVLSTYPAVSDIRWVQEEPQNMGAWNYFSARLQRLMPPTHSLRYLGRAMSGSPATGSHRVHQAEQEEIVREALG
ncbi:MAG: multifunctional oxoglutarate decarboxylase/oxoglutarate dehydrogenase thiamine pyrophosphate-binding subunit/dihydrolipoyllysine-residue succinyltransferase subunit [Acidobacteria bacterium]|nr:multifunctional oxoglutarate decarboxylase/oxoglutarate dehydrogenase thiamine pyrophosphate-binding subunit/dihydrolipoyllysine-residue succinyltransferase subunit [Acidobacteriota bacterium]